MKVPGQNVSKLKTQKSIKRASGRGKFEPYWRIKFSTGEYSWSNRKERVDIIRKGLPYDAIEVIGKKSGLAINQVLTRLGMPQTTYNKKKRDKDLLSGRDSEVVLLLYELLDFGQEVFNNENEKFQRWLKKPNVSLGGVKPDSMFDSVTGIEEVKNSLIRLEFGNMA